MKLGVDEVEPCHKKGDHHHDGNDGVEVLLSVIFLSFRKGKPLFPIAGSSPSGRAVICPGYLHPPPFNIRPRSLFRLFPIKSLTFLKFSLSLLFRFYPSGFFLFSGTFPRSRSLFRHFPIRHFLIPPFSFRSFLPLPVSASESSRLSFFPSILLSFSFLLFFFFPVFPSHFLLTSLNLRHI